MTKIVINTCFGGFGLSHKAILRYAEIKMIPLRVEKKQSTLSYFVEDATLDKLFYVQDVHRTEPALIQVVEELGHEANDRFSNLKIVELPPGTKYRIDEFDGHESIETIDSIDWETA